MSLAMLISLSLHCQWKRKHGNAPLVHSVGIDIAVAMLVGDHFAASGETDVGAVPAAAVLFERRAVSFMLFA